MGDSIKTRGVHHVVLTVADLQRSLRFYTEVLGFQPIADLGTRVLLSDGSTVLGVGLAPVPESAIKGDCFDENRVGLDHLSLIVDSRSDLESAVAILDARGVPHGDIKDMAESFGISVLTFRDPDNIQVELTARM